MLCNVVHKDILEYWNKWLKPLLIAIQMVMQDPFKLFLGHKPHGLLDVIRENGEKESSTTKN